MIRLVYFAFFILPFSFYLIGPYTYLISSYQHIFTKLPSRLQRDRDQLQRNMPSSEILESHALPLLIDLNIDQISAALSQGLFTSVELTEIYLARINQVNGLLNAVSEINPDAVDIARQLDEERRNGKVRGPLHGVPIVLKDAIVTLDKLKTTGGSSFLNNATYSFESPIVTKLRESGAIILGKTNLTEFCNHRTTKAPNGKSATGGQCYGAYYPKQDPGGSSSGSAVVTALGLAAASVGTETWGSITVPCQKSSLVGIKPTPGLTSRRGVLLVNEYQDTIGPITRCVKDAAIMLQAMIDKDSLDFKPWGYPEVPVPDYAAAANKTDLTGLRIAAPLEVIKQDSEVTAAYHSALDTLREIGATVVDDAKFPEWTTNTRNENQPVLDLAYQILIKKNLEAFLKDLKTNPLGIKTLADVIRYLKDAPDEEYDKWKATVFEDAENQPYDVLSPEFKESLALRNHYGEEIQKLLDEYSCDVLVVPGSGDTPSDMGGNPAIVVPLGHYSKEWPIKIYRNEMVYVGPRIPFGLMFIGRKFSEEKLIEIAYAYEQKTMTRQKVRPCIQSNIELPQKSHYILQNGKL